MRIPFDSLTLAAAVHEMRSLVGGAIQRIVQPDERSLALMVYGRGEQWLLLSWDPQFARAHLIGRRPERSDHAGPLRQECRMRLDGGRVAFVRQRGFDRILEVGVETATGPFVLVAELMGKHANVMLVDAQANVVGAAKWLGASKSRRPVLPGQRYHPPPFPPRPSLLEASPEDDLRDFEGASPFLLRWIEHYGLDALQRRVREYDFSPVAVPGQGAYPVSVAALGYTEFPRERLSIALETHFAEEETRRRTETLRHSLATRLERVLLARDVAIRELEAVSDTAARAGKLQREGELILAYASMVQPGDTKLDAWDYDGQPVTLSLQPDRTPLENAQRLFDKAKRAKASAATVTEQLARLRGDRDVLKGLLARMEDADVDTLREVEEEADRRRYLHHQPAPVARKEDRPYEGHAIRELLAPGGWRVLYGENAEANDFLTVRVAKPHDWWLHVRGATSAHVVIVTNRQPEKVQRDALLFAAEVAKRNSISKHASHVHVDYTLKRYVRRPKGSAPGSAVYTMEKTLILD